MKLYGAKLYVVKDEVDYFKQKEFNKIVAVDEDDKCIYQASKIKIGLDKYTD